MRGSLFVVAFATIAAVFTTGAVRAEAPRPTPPGAQSPSPQAAASAGAARSQTPSPQSAQAPLGGRAFGEHVSGMAPEHPLEHGGQMFGQCVSEMAITGQMCEHMQP